MKKIRMNDKAVAVPLAIVIVALIVIAGVAWFTIGSGGSKSYWETDTDFGMWQDELIIEFADGTTQSLKMIEEGSGKVGTITYNGREITSAKIKLSAKVTGSGYDGAKVECNSFGYSFISRDSSGNIVEENAGGSSNNLFTIPLGNTQQIFLGGPNIIANIENKPSLYPDGTYTLQFHVRGYVQYRGYPEDSGWETAPNPPDRGMQIQVSRGPAGSIVVTLYSEIVT